VWVLVGVLSAFAQTIDSATLAAVDAIAVNVLSQGEAPGLAIGIMHDGTVVFEKGFGTANLEHRVPVTRDTAFEIASLTKQFTAAGILLLAQDGVLSTSDKVDRFFPDFPRSNEVTIAQLLTHSSGLSSYNEKPEYPAFAAQRHTLSQILDWIKADRYFSDPGTEFHYSNSGYLLLRAVIERVTETSLASFLQRRVFDRIGLRDTRVLTDAGEIIPNLASGYILKEGAAGRFANRPFSDPSNNGGGMGMVSTIGDLMKWERALFSNEVLSPASLIEMTTPAKFNSGDVITPSIFVRYPQRRYGYGLALVDDNGRVKVGHLGSMSGFNSVLVTYPTEHLTIVVLTNGNTVAVPIEQDIATVLFKK
jgi:CubicO group peptidase (beta-lactamase class C family)